MCDDKEKYNQERRNSLFTDVLQYSKYNHESHPTGPLPIAYYKRNYDIIYGTIKILI